MIFSSSIVALVALVNANEAFAKDLLKRQYDAPPGGWNNPELYKDVNWASVFGNTGSAPPQATATGTSGGPVVQEHDAVNPVSPSPSSQSSSGGNNNPGGSSTSSASCSSGCSMTISFSDDTLDVPFTAGSGGSPSTGSTKGTCICMSGGSVRVNIGSNNPGDKTTLIEGNAAGLSSASFYDVSYVEGYSYPVVCWSEDGSGMSGHNVDLYEHGACEGGGSKMGDICENPGYVKLATGGDGCWKCTLPSSFFGPASGAAYTYPYDDAPCASGPMTGGQYKSPMATGGSLVCCVGPQCRENSFSAGGLTSMGNCNRADCKPCSGSGATCSNGCGGGSKAKRDIERIFESPENQYFQRRSLDSHAEEHEQMHKRHQHGHRHGHTHN